MVPSCTCACVFVIYALAAPAAHGMRPEKRFAAEEKGDQKQWRLVDGVLKPAGACPDLYAWAQRAVEKQLAPWNLTGFAEEMAYAAAETEPKFRNRALISVVWGKVFGDGHAWVEYMKRAVKNWPFSEEELHDLNFIVAAESQGDMPTMMKGEVDPTVVGPSFANARNDNFLDVLMPTAQRPQFMDDYFIDTRATALGQAKNNTWRSRKDLAVWRGSTSCTVGCGSRGAAFFPERHANPCYDDLWNLNNQNFQSNEIGFSYGCGDGDASDPIAALQGSEPGSCTQDFPLMQGGWIQKKACGLWKMHPRMQLVLTSVDRGDKCGLDAKFTSLNLHRHFLALLHQNTSAMMGDFVGDEETAQHRYVINVGANGYADRSWRMFALGNTVLQVDDGWREWYSDLLKPYEHYIPLKPDASDVCEKLEWARQNEEKAEAIAENGRKFVEECLDLDLVDLYVAEMMRQLGRLFKKGNGDRVFPTPDHGKRQRREH